jgi:hypothetical protein
MANNFSHNCQISKQNLKYVLKIETTTKFKGKFREKLAAKQQTT